MELQSVVATQASHNLKSFEVRAVHTIHTSSTLATSSSRPGTGSGTGTGSGSGCGCAGVVKWYRYVRCPPESTSFSSFTLVHRSFIARSSLVHRSLARSSTARCPIRPTSFVHAPRGPPWLPGIPWKLVFVPARLPGSSCQGTLGTKQLVGPPIAHQPRTVPGPAWEVPSWDWERRAGTPKHWS